MPRKTFQSPKNINEACETFARMREFLKNAGFEIAVVDDRLTVIAVGKNANKMPKFTNGVYNTPIIDVKNGGFVDNV